jgi:hypothetical protein
MVTVTPGAIVVACVMLVPLAHVVFALMVTPPEAPPELEPFEELELPPLLLLPPLPLELLPPLLLLELLPPLPPPLLPLPPLEPPGFCCWSTGSGAGWTSAEHPPRSAAVPANETANTPETRRRERMGDLSRRVVTNRAPSRVSAEIHTFSARNGPPRGAMWLEDDPVECLRPIQGVDVGTGCSSFFHSARASSLMCRP